MNSKIKKLMGENEKDRAKIAALQARIKDRNAQIQEIENTEIIGVYREYNLTPGQFVTLIQQIKAGAVPVPQPEQEAE